MKRRTAKEQKTKANGKAHAHVVERRVARAADREEVVAFLPAPVRTTGDVLATLDEAALWLDGLEAMILADCSRRAIYLVTFDVRRVLEGCIQALREGKFPEFFLHPNDAEGWADWIDEARRVLAYAKTQGLGEENRLAVLGYGPDAVELVRDLTHAELGWLASEFHRRARVCFAGAELLVEGTLRAAGRGEGRA